jgi:hypothetical protein
MVALAGCLLLLGGLVTQPLQASDETTLLNLTNQARANAGAPALRLDPQLNQAAQRHSNDMAAREVLSHTGSDGSTVGSRVTAAGYSWQAVGENVLFRGDMNAQGAFDQWWNSPGHRNNMLNATYCDIGLAHARSSSGRFYYTMVLGRKRGATNCAPVPTSTSRPPTATATSIPPTGTPAPTASLTGTLRLQGRATAPNTTFTLQLTRGSAAPILQTVTTDANSTFTLTNLAPGSYTVQLKHSQYLSASLLVTLNAGANPIAAPELLAGDVNNDNQVTIIDFAALALTFNLRAGAAGYDARADFNADQSITLADFSLLASNINRVGG